MNRIIMLLVLVMFSGCMCSNPSKGQKVGRIVKIEDSGWFCKTHEAELIRGGLVGGSGAANGAAFDFTIADEATYKAAEAAMLTNKEIELDYTRPMIVSLCSTDTGVFATGVKVSAGQ